jgi:phosphoglucomutase
MKQLFDFPLIQTLLNRSDFKMIFDAMHGVAGPYAKAIFGQELGNKAILKDCEPKPDFAGHHPDPNLSCGKELVELMGYETGKKSEFDFGAACDGDADRNMILGKAFFVTPSDSLALLVSLSHYFLKSPLKGVARSMPTSGAVDKVANKLGIKLYETPTGWKFFGNLMEEDLIGMCGEESFGTGSPHVREKDGIWTILAWLQVLARTNEGIPEGKLISVEDLLKELWTTYGRNYYTRYDYESIPK